MGASVPPAKYFPMPQPFGTTPQGNVLSQAQPYQQIANPGFAAIPTENMQGSSAQQTDGGSGGNGGGRQFPNPFLRRWANLAGGNHTGSLQE